MNRSDLSAAPAGAGAGAVLPADAHDAANAANAADAAPAADNRCPRCGGGFHCGVNDAGPCACSTVQLSAAQRAGLRQRYGSCLCLACLASLPALP